MSASTASLKRRVMSSAKWTLFGHGGSQLMRFVSNLILTRLLAPDMFGVMGLAYTVFTGLAMLSDLGLTDVITRSPRGDEPKFLNVAWVVQIVRGVVIAACALILGLLWGLPDFASMIPSGSVYADPRVPALIAAMAVGPFLAAFESTKSIVARRRMNIEILIKVDMVCQAGTTISTLVLAYFYPSVWALAFGWAFGSLMKTILSHLVLPGPANRLEWETAAFWDVVRLGKWALISSPVMFMVMSADRIMLNGFLDAKTMGYYSVAFLLVTALQSAIGSLMHYSVMPALAEVNRERPAEFKSAIYKIRTPLNIACLVPAGMLFMLGETIIRILYDSRYLPAGWILSVVAVGLAAVQFNVFEQVLKAVGNFRMLTIMNVVRLIVMVSVIWIGYTFFGAKGAIIAVPCAAFVSAAALLAVSGMMGFVDLKRELQCIPLFGAGVLLGWIIKLAATALLWPAA